VYIRVFGSKLFTFIVGEGKRAISLHTEVVAKLSPALNVLINGPMSEAEKGETTLDDVLEDTFLRFCQFAYTGDYETPSFEVTPIHESSDTGSVSTSSAAAVAELDEQRPGDPIEGGPSEDDAGRREDFWGIINHNMKSKKERPKSPTLRQEFDKKVYSIELVDSTRLEAQTLCETRANQLEEEDYTPVFLGHAYLYAFAEKWGIESLKELTLHKIHLTLSEFTLYEARCGDIVELVNFVYSNDNTPDLEDGLDALRALVIHYVMCELEILIEAPCFISMQEQQGLFSRDLLLMMRRRLK